MPLYVIKNRTGNFDPASWPAGFTPVRGIENRFFICECPTKLEELEMPEEVFGWHKLSVLPNGKRQIMDVFVGEVNFSEDIDAKGRRAIQYTDEQLQNRLDYFKWIMKNVFAPNAARMGLLVNGGILTEIEGLESDTAAQEFMKANLYYDL